MEIRAMVEYLPGFGYQVWFSSGSPPLVSTPTHTLYSVELCMFFPSTRLVFHIVRISLKAYNFEFSDRIKPTNIIFICYFCHGKSRAFIAWLVRAWIMDKCFKISFP